MSPEQFCYWLQGFAELSGNAPPTPEQWKSIREHIATVFHKVTPPVVVKPDEKDLQSIFDKYIKSKRIDLPTTLPYTLGGPMC